MADLKVRTRPVGASAVLGRTGFPHVTSATGGEIDIVTSPSQPGFNPLDLLYSSLSACLVLSARMAASQTRRSRPHHRAQGRRNRREGHRRPVAGQDLQHRLLHQGRHRRGDAPENRPRRRRRDLHGEQHDPRQSGILDGHLRLTLSDGSGVARAAPATISTAPGRSRAILRPLLLLLAVHDGAARSPPERRKHGTPCRKSPPPSPQSAPSHRFALAALILGGAAIGGSPIFVRLSEVGPMATGFLARGAGFLSDLHLLADQGWRHRPKPETWADRGMLILPGVILAVDLITWHLSITITSVANATLLANLAPVFVTIIGVLLHGCSAVTRVFVAGIAAGDRRRRHPQGWSRGTR